MWDRLPEAWGDATKVWLCLGARPTIDRINCQGKCVNPTSSYHCGHMRHVNLHRLPFEPKDTGRPEGSRLLGLLNGP